MNENQSAMKNESTGDKKIYLTRTGLPLSFHLEWPFRKSTAGADFWYLHANIHLENGRGLHSLVAVNLSATVREVMPTLEARDTEGPIINALRKEVDRRQLEFMKSGKLVPVHFSSRHYDFKRNTWVDADAPGLGAGKRRVDRAAAGRPARLQRAQQLEPSASRTLAARRP